MDVASLDRPVRIASGLLLLGVVLTFVGSLATIPMNGVGSTDRTAWVLAHLLLVLGAVATLVGLPAIYTPQRDRVGWLGLLGFGLLFVGYLGVGFFFAAVVTFLLPWVYDKASCTLGCHLLSTSDGPPLYGWFYLIEQLATFIGLVLLGVASVRAGLFSRWAGYLLALAGVLELLFLIVNVPQLVAVVPLILGLTAVAWMALTILTGEVAIRR